jgi:hypothetical protein
MSEADSYTVVRHNRYWHVLGDGFCGSLDPDELGNYLQREGPWEDLSEALQTDPARRCSDCTFPDE